MDSASDIRTRTFGVEIEMCNVERAKVTLPIGFSWSKDEEIVNTDGSSNNGFGGEVNTPPLHMRPSDLHTLKKVYETMANAGGVIKWSVQTHIHIYAGDLSVEQLKKVFLFFYVCYPYFKRYAHLTDWDELTTINQPLPTEMYYDGLIRANTLQDIQRLFTNNSPKGYIRHAVNISAYFKTKTIEFRTFRGTNNFYEALNCVLSAYRMFYYAINHESCDYKAISSYDEFCAVTRLKYTTPPILVPLLYQGNPYSPTECYQSKPLSYNSKQVSVLLEAIKSNGDTDLCIVNGFMYYYELALFEKLNVSIYCQDEFCFLLYLLANGKKAITYSGKLAWLEEFNSDSPSRQLAIALYLFKIQKYLLSRSIRNDNTLNALKLKAKESIQKTEEANTRLMQLLTKSEFKVGTLQEAVKSKKNIFFNYGRNYKPQKSVYRLIQKNCDVNIDCQFERNEYYKFVERLPADAHFYFFSNSPYLSNLHKVSVIYASRGERRGCGRYLYCNTDSKSRSDISFRDYQTEAEEVLPPDNLAIDNPELLKILRVSRYYLYKLQQKYVKKVGMKSHVTFPYVVMYGDYLLGGFGFDLPKHKGYDLFQLTDFCTNNKIPRLSKLILLCIQSEAVQRSLSRSMRKTCKKVITIAYTHMPVSMKYRGVYKKEKGLCTPTYLAYEGELGLYATSADIIGKYQKLIQNGDK